MIVELRHDVDGAYVLTRSLPKMISLEEKYGVRSTFFLYVYVVRSDTDCRVLHEPLFNTVWFCFGGGRSAWNA